MIPAFPQRLNQARVLALGLVACLLVSHADGQVVISELSAENDVVLDDVEGEASDWIELHNPSLAPLDIGGHFLTDDPSELDKWRLPTPTVIPAGGFLVVFASDKDRAISGAQLHTNFKLSPAGEYLALVDSGGGIVDAYAPAFPSMIGDLSVGREFAPALTTTVGHFVSPTPGAANGLVSPAVFSITCTPPAPLDGDDLVIEARIVPAPGRSLGTVLLAYRVSFSGEVTVAMNDAGGFGDRVAGDGIYTSTIPAAASSAAQMVRWRVTANSTGGSPPGRLPLYLSPSDSPQYGGVMIADPSVVSPLDTLFWFVQDPSAADSSGTRASLWFGGEFYDNVFVRPRGNTSVSWPKKNYKFDFHPGHHFRFDPSVGRSEEINLNSSYSDKAFIRQRLSWHTYFVAGVPGSLSTHWRVQQNGTFHSVGTFVEQPDEELLERSGLDGRGALYKMYNEATSAFGGVEKKTRTWEGNGDLQALVSGVVLSGLPLETYLFDNVDLPAIANYLAATAIMHDNDHVAKNYYLWRDSEGDGEWRFVPWDKDLTFGRNYTLGGGVLNDTMWADTAVQSHPLFGDLSHPKIDNLWNRLIDACYRTPRARAMTMRRLRTLMDELLDPPGTALPMLRFESLIDQYESELVADVALDIARWGVPGWGSPTLSFAPAITQLETGYLAPRRTYLYTTHGPSGLGTIPAAPGPVSVAFGAVERDPASANQDEEYLELINSGASAAVISGWRLSGGISFVFAGGSVIPAAESAYVSPHAPSFRARMSSPRGGERRLLLAPYDGHINPFEYVELRDGAGQLIDTVAALESCGDCNGDGTTTILDALLAAQHAAALIGLVDPRFAACNVNGTRGGQSTAAATIDVLDALELARHAAALVPTLSCTL